jgi:glycosyltransferase involved in cell wall biosynthesis
MLQLYSGEMMKIAYDLRRIANVGIGRYMETLVETVLKIAPQHQYLLILTPETIDRFSMSDNVSRIHAQSKYYSLSEQLEIPKLLKHHHIDLLHAPHFVIPVNKPCPIIVTIHDAIHLVYPQDIRSRIGRIYASLMMQAAIRVADKIITVSEYSKRDLVRLAGADPKKIRVISPFLTTALNKQRDPKILRTIRDRYGIKRDYILYMGIVRERKNHIGLIRSFAQLIGQGRDLELVISGPIDSEKSIIYEIAQTLNVSDRLVITGFVPESDMASLYSGATIYACPSLYEGFGYTPLEAMACGVPVVCHEGTSLPEVCGDAALYADARQPVQFADALLKVLDDNNMRMLLIQRGYENVQRFSASNSVTAILDLYAEVQSESADASLAHKSRGITD